MKSGSPRDLEHAVNEVVVAYEQVLLEQYGWHVRAQRTRNMINNHGVREAVDRLVRRKKPSTGFAALVDEGKRECTFEAVVLRHPALFSTRAVDRATQRLGQEAR